MQPPSHNETIAATPERVPARRRSTAFLLSVVGITIGIAVAGAIGYLAGLHQGIASDRPEQGSAIAGNVPEPATAEQRPPAENFAGLTLDGESFVLAETAGTPTLLVFWAHW